MSATRRPRRTFTDDDVSADRIAEAALTLCRDGGVAALTMRALARELDLTIPTIYRTVGDRDGVLDIVVDRIAAELVSITPIDADLTARLTIAYDWLVSVEGAAMVLIERLPLTNSSLQYLGDSAALLERSSPDVATSAARWRVLWTYVVGCAAAAGARSTTIDVTSLDVPEHSMEILAALASKDARTMFLDGLQILLHAFASDPS
ncbi:MAG: TetR/AcrR family transcriptional regulator [Actinomycetota bacterium]